MFILVSYYPSSYLLYREEKCKYSNKAFNAVLETVLNDETKECEARDHGFSKLKLNYPYVKFIKTVVYPLCSKI